MTHEKPEWIVIHMAHNAALANKLSALLTEDGFLIRTRCVEGGEGCVELLALASEAAEARRALLERGID